MRGPTWPNRAFSAAIVRSHIMCRTWPPPIDQPATIATTGLGQVRISRWNSSTLSISLPDSERYPAWPRTRWSPPAQKARSPSPQRMTTPISGSFLASSSAARISSTVRGVNELRTSGRLMVILAMRSALWYLTSAKPFATSLHASAGRIVSAVSVVGFVGG